MSVPKHKTTSSRQKRRRSHHSLKKQNLAKCDNCGETVKPHHACLDCGYYNGRKAVDVSRKQDRVIEQATADNS